MWTEEAWGQLTMVDRILASKALVIRRVDKAEVLEVLDVVKWVYPQGIRCSKSSTSRLTNAR